MLSRRAISLYLLLGTLLFGWLWWRDRSSLLQPGGSLQATVDKQPIAFATRTFDLLNPPADMPPLASGDGAECESRFLSNASVGGQSRQSDATHGVLTITRINLTLQLNITIWVPTDATPHVIEHEEGHRQISEYYYQTADVLAGQIATAYMNKQVEIAGADLNAESDKTLQQMATEITEQYNRELNPEPTQLLFDAITDHGRNAVVVKDAIAAAIKNVSIGPAQPVTSPGN